MSTAGGDRRGPALALASFSLGAVGLILAVSTWAAWLLVLPPVRETMAYNWVAVVFPFVLGALWFAILPLSVLTLIFGFLTRPPRTTGLLAPLGMLTGGLALVLALAGAVGFVVSASSWTIPVRPL